jgi:hypothetical protein
LRAPGFIVRYRAVLDFSLMGKLSRDPHCLQ